MTSSISRKILLASEQDWRAARRVFFHPDDLKASKICTGDPVALSSGTNISSGVAFSVGIAWPSEELTNDTIAVSSRLLLTAQLKPGQQANIVSLAGFGTDSKRHIRGLAPPREALTIQLKETSDPRASVGQKEKQRDWLALLLRESLVSVKYVTPTQIVEVQYEGTLRHFSVVSVSSSSSDSGNDPLSNDFETLASISRPQIWLASWNTKVVLDDIRETKITASPAEELHQKPSNEAYATIGGLDKQISQIRDLLEIPLTRPDLFRHFGLKPPRGILLHGPPGTGKTHLARAIAASTNSSVLVINGPELSSAYHGETESKLRSVFEEAKTKSPCIVVLDEIDALVPKREEGGGGEVEKRVVATLLTLLDGMDEDKENAGHVVVIGTTNRPNAIDPALRRPGRFDKEFEIGIPNIEDRASILKVLLAKTPNNVSNSDLHTLASRAHGYVGADLSAVIREAGTIAIKRYISLLPSSTPSLVLTFSDLEASLPLIRPSAMRSLFIETPPMRFSEIGGQSHVIKRLKEAVEWPLLHPETFTRLGIKPPKGVLLYGPPGCSKTVLARACATESGVNFVAVKGPELLSKYVGESERAVREIFRKARAASPSIILFDEIDALASSRTSDTPGSSEGVLTSLLNEMDGVQELIGVTVIAATNRPDAIDSALMRPGRLDRILYVGPPDQAGREEILKIRIKNMQVEADMDIAHIASLAIGCSGAEMSALCQEAALQTMQDNMEAPFIPQSAFVSAAKSITRQITPTMLAQFERWRLASGHQSA